MPKVVGPEVLHRERPPADRVLISALAPLLVTQGCRDEVAAWLHQLSGPELEQTLGGGEGQGGLAAAGHGAAKSWTCVSD